MSDSFCEVGKPLPAWTEGTLDMHHINTGRGDSAFYVLPDGTTMLVDAGEMDPTSERVHSPRNAKARPNDSRPPHAWIADYIHQMMPDITGLDYAFLTHFHDDHLGCVTERAAESRLGPYKCTGLTGVGDILPFGTLVDRDYPDYNYPMPIDHPRIVEAMGKNPGYQQVCGTFRNYRRFVEWQRDERGMAVEKFTPGMKDQFVLKRSPNAFPSFEIRNICGNGVVWTGLGTTARQQFPEIEGLPLDEVPDENPVSCGIRMRYGKFTFFNGADIPGLPGLGKPAWWDMETPVAQVVGKVDVAVLNHHGYRDTQNEFYVRTLRPRVWIHQSWSSDQPGQDTLTRLTSTYLYPGPRDLFATEILEATRIVFGPAIDRAYRSTRGHIVVRVLPGGEAYYVITLDDTTIERCVTGLWGPYETR